MSTEQERSFIARIRFDYSMMLFFDQMLPRECFESSEFSTGKLPGLGNLLTTAHIYDQRSNRMRSFDGEVSRSVRARSKHMIVYFRCIDDYYNIQIRSEAYLGKYLSQHTNGSLGAFPEDGNNTTSFNLLNAHHDIITLDDLQSDKAVVFLKVRNAGTVNRQLMQDPKIYHYSDQPGESVEFNLTILERNVPSPTSTEPYPLYLEPVKNYLEEEEED